MAKEKKYSVVPGKEGQIYLGADPVTRSGMIKVKVGEMSEEQLAAWLNMNPKTAAAFVVGPDVNGKKDNTPEKALPKKPE